MHLFSVNCVQKCECEVKIILYGGSTCVLLDRVEMTFVRDNQIYVVWCSVCLPSFYPLCGVILVFYCKDFNFK